MILIPIVDIYKYARWRRLENLPLNIATLTLSLLAWSRVTREKEKVKEARVEKPIECGKSFHLITQRDHKLTDKRPRKRAIFYMNSENMPTIKVYLSAICLPLNYKTHWIFSGIPNMLSLASIYVHKFDGMIHWIWLQISFWMWSNQIMSSILHILYNIVYEFWMGEREKSKAILILSILTLKYLQLCYVIVMSLKMGLLDATIPNDDKMPSTCYASWTKISI